MGEVFTSPKLKGTEGILHVSQVYLNDLKYNDLQITFEDGKIKDYTCKNFDTEEENKKFIKQNVMFNHETLPIGEFAIGTNTTAYMVAKKYHVVYKLPILIVEKWDHILQWVIPAIALRRILKHIILTARK